MHPIVIVGSGLAGYTTAREFRKLDPDTPLTLVCSDDGRFYSKPNLSNAFKLGKSHDTLATATAAQMAEQLNATILTHHRVRALIPTDRTLQIEDSTLEYSHLVMALGADPIRLNIDGDGVDDIMAVNDLIDYGLFRQRIEDKQRLVIMGAGLIGCEFANDLVNASFKVDVIDPADWPLSRLVPQPAGEHLQQALAEQGVNWRFGTTVQRIDRDDAGYQVTLADGSELSADAVLSAVGLVPRTGLAKAAGLAVNRGIVVDRYLRTDHQNIYALGDCAEVDGLVLPYIMPIMHAGRALAKTLAGDATAVSYPAMPVVVKTPSHPAVVAPPSPDASGDWHNETVGNGIKAQFLSPDGQLLGFVLTGDAVKERQALAKALPAVLS